MPNLKQRLELYVLEPEANSPEAATGVMAAKFAMLRSWGIDQVVVETPASGIAASDAGLDVVLANWWGVSTAPDAVATAVKQAATIPRLCEIKMADEPIYWQEDAFDAARANQPAQWLYTPAAFAAARKQAQAAWPGPNAMPPLSLAFYGPEEKWGALERAFYMQCLPLVDLLRVNNYPFDDPNHYRQIWMWNENARRCLERAGVKAPICTTLQSWSDETEPSGLRMMPSVAELRAMAYQALFGGVAAVSFYQFEAANWASLAGYIAQFQALVKELAAAAVELDGASLSSMLGYDSVLRTAATRGTAQWSYVLNTGHDPNFNDQLLGLELRKQPAPPATWPWDGPPASPPPTPPVPATAIRQAVRSPVAKPRILPPGTKPKTPPKP